MEYSPMLVVMLWALTPSEAASVAAKVQEMPTPGMTVHQESYFTFNHGKPFVAEQDPLTGAILNLKTTPIVQDDYVYEEDDEESDGIDRKDGPKVFTRNDISYPSKDSDLHKFLNLPVHYSSSGKFPLISSSYANTKVQGHSSGSISNHRLSPTTSTVPPTYHSIKTSSSVSVSIENKKTAPTQTTPKIITTSTTTTTTTTTNRPTTNRPTTTTTTTSTTTTPKPTTYRTTTKPPPSYEYEYEYDYEHEPEKEMTDKKTTTHNILDFFNKDYGFLGAFGSSSNKNESKFDPPLTTVKPKVDPVMVAPNTNIFIPSDYLKPNNVKKEEQNKTEQIMSTTVTTTLKPLMEQLTTATPSMNNTSNQTVNVKPLYNDTEKVLPVTEDMKTLKEVTESSINESFVNKYKSEEPTKVFSANIEEGMNSTSLKSEKRPIIFDASTMFEENENESQTKKEDETKIPNIMDNKPNPLPSESEHLPTIVSPSKPIGFHQPSQKPENRPEVFIPQQNGHFNPYQRPFSAPAMVNTDMVPPLRPADVYYQRPQERPYPDILQYRPMIQSRPQNNRPIDNNPMNRPPPYNAYENKPTELTGKRPSPQPFMSQSHYQTDMSPIEYIPNKAEPKPFVSLPSSTTTRPVEPTSVLHNRPYGFPQKEEPPSRPIDTDINSEASQKQPSRLPDKPLDTRYPPFTQLPSQEVEKRPFFSDFKPQNLRPEQVQPPVILGVTNHHEIKAANEKQNHPAVEPFSSNQYPPQFNQPSKVESHFIKVSPGQENPSYSLQTSFSIGVPPVEEAQQGMSNSNPIKVAPSGNQGVGQVLFPDEEEKRPWAFQEEKRPAIHPHEGEQIKYPRPSWESHLKPPTVFNHLRKETYIHKRPKPRPDLPNILPQFRPNAKVGHVEPQAYFKTPLDTLQPPPLPRPQFLRADPEDDIQSVHRRNGLSTRVVPTNPSLIPKRAVLRSEDEKTDPVFVVYPANNAQDGVVVGTRGPQQPLPPDNLEIEDSFPLETNKNFQARVDTPILKGKVTTKPVIKNDFPYQLIKPTEPETKVITTVTKEYTAFSPTSSPTEKEHDSEINLIPYLQDYQPFATKKPLQEPPKWNTENETKPISVTLKTQKTEITTSKIDNHKSNENPTPQDFQAPFYASLSAPNQGWSVLKPRPSPEKEEETTTAKVIDEQEEKFDIQNFKPQLFGGFQPIIPPAMENKETIKEETKM